MSPARNTLASKSRPAVRQPGTLADIPGRALAGRPHIPDCPGLRRSISGVFFRDAAGQLHNLGTEKRLRPKEVAADTRVALTPADVRDLIKEGELYPVFRRNARRIEVFACAIGDWWLRQSLREVKHHG